MVALEGTLEVASHAHLAPLESSPLDVVEIPPEIARLAQATVHPASIMQAA